MKPSGATAFIRLCVQTADDINRSAMRPLTKPQVEAAFTKALKLHWSGSLGTTADGTIRFSFSQTEGFSNTVLGFSKIVARDDRPVVCCLVRPDAVDLMLVNSTFIQKVSHSSQRMSRTKLRGSINGGDIFEKVGSVSNNRDNLVKAFELHAKRSSSKNIDRIVDETLNITGKHQADIDVVGCLSALKRWPDIVKRLKLDPSYLTTEIHLGNLVSQRSAAILNAASDANSNSRGRNIEQLISGGPANHDFADFVHEAGGFKLFVDIKSKLIGSSSAPKGISIDRLLELALRPKALVFVLLVLIEPTKGVVQSRLVPVTDETLLSRFAVQELWSGRDRIGHIQFSGSSLTKAVENPASDHRKNWDLLLKKIKDLA